MNLLLIISMIASATIALQHVYKKVTWIYSFDLVMEARSDLHMLNVILFIVSGAKCWALSTI